MARILMVLTSHDTLGSTGRKTGFHFEELAVPYWTFRDGGHSVDLGSIAGGKPPHDPESLKERAGENPPAVARFLGDKDAMASLARTIPIASARPGPYDAVFIPGGHGTMWDMPDNRDLARFVGAVFDAGGAVGAVCHGPAGLLDAKARGGSSILRGRRITGFTNAEEEAVGLTDTVPFLLETRLSEQGGEFEGGEPFAPFAARDGTLATGQNPASSEAVARHMLEILRERAGARAA